MAKSNTPFPDENAVKTSPFRIPLIILTLIKMLVYLWGIFEVEQFRF